MATPIKADPLNFFFQADYVSVGLDHVCLNAIESLRASLIAKLIDTHDAYFVKVEDTITQPMEGRAYRAAYVDSIQVTGFSQSKHHPTGGPRTQHDAIWMFVQYTVYSGNIEDGTFGGDEAWTRGTPIAEQALQLGDAIAKHEAAGTHVGGTLPSGGHLHLNERFAIWPETETLTLREREVIHNEIRKEYKLCLKHRCFDY